MKVSSGSLAGPVMQAEIQILYNSRNFNILAYNVFVLVLETAWELRTRTTCFSQVERWVTGAWR